MSFFIVFQDRLFPTAELSKGEREKIDVFLKLLEDSGVGQIIYEETKKDRIHRLLNLSKSITKELNKTSIGKKYNVICVKQIDDNLFETNTDSGKTIFVEGNLKINNFYLVEITEFSNKKLFAKITN